MQRMAKFSITIFFTIMFAGFVYAQPGVADPSVLDTSTNYALKQLGSENIFTIRQIEISGNKKTKESVILRELPFKSGDTYALSELVKKFEVARKQLLNTTLFHEVIVALKSFEGNNVDIMIAVK